MITMMSSGSCGSGGPAGSGGSAGVTARSYGHPSHVRRAPGVYPTKDGEETPMSTRHAVVDSDLGPITIVATDKAITGLYFRHHIRRPAQETFGPEVSVSEDGLLNQAAEQLLEYLAGGRHEFDIPLVAGGDDFQQVVWSIVKAVPFGETTTYGHIADRLGDRALAQQVGQAVGANPLC